MLIVIEDQNPGEIMHVEKHVFPDITELTLDTIAIAACRISNVDESNVSDVHSDFEETGEPTFTDDKQVAVWNDGVTGTHFTFILS